MLLQQEMALFHKDTEEVYQSIDAIHEYIEILDARFQISMNHELQDGYKLVACNDIIDLVRKTNTTSTDVRNRLKVFVEENDNFARQNKEHTTMVGSRAKLLQKLTKAFIYVMQLVDQALHRHRANVKRNLEQLLRHMNPEAKEEDIEIALREGSAGDIVQNSQTFLQMNIEGKELAKKQLLCLTAGHNDIIKLAESMVNVNHLLLDMQILMETQTDLLEKYPYRPKLTKGQFSDQTNEKEKGTPQQRRPFRMAKSCMATLLITTLCLILIPALVILILQNQPPVNKIPVITIDGRSNMPASTSPVGRGREPDLSGREFQFRQGKGLVPVAIDIPFVLHDDAD